MKKLLAAIAGIFVKVYKSVVKGGDPTIVKLPDNLAITTEEIDHCITVVNNIKDVVNNAGVILITDLTPLSFDNIIRSKISDAIPTLLAALTFEKAALTAAIDKDILVNDLLAKVRFSDDQAKDMLYHTMAARLIMVISDGKVTWSEAVGILELYFKQIFSPTK